MTRFSFRRCEALLLGGAVALALAGGGLFESAPAVAEGAAAKPVQPALQADSTGLDVARKAVSLCLYDEPRTLAPGKAQDNMASMILSHAMEGLTRLDPANKALPAMAESW